MTCNQPWLVIKHLSLCYAHGVTVKVRLEMSHIRTLGYLARTNGLHSTVEQFCNTFRHSHNLTTWFCEVCLHQVSIRKVSLFLQGNDWIDWSYDGVRQNSLFHNRQHFISAGQSEVLCHCRYFLYHSRVFHSLFCLRLSLLHLSLYVLHRLRSGKRDKCQGCQRQKVGGFQRHPPSGWFCVHHLKSSFNWTLIQSIDNRLQSRDSCFPY